MTCIRCRIDMKNLPLGIWSNLSAEPCKPGLHITDRRYTSVKFLQFVRDAVYAYAHALDDLWRTECDAKPGVCDKMHDGSVLKFYLQNVNFVGKISSSSKVQIVLIKF